MKMNLKTAAIFIVLACASSPCRVAAQDDAPIEDKDIKVVHVEKLTYPAVAAAARIEGLVVIRVSLDDQGNVVKAVALSGKVLLTDRSLANVKSWKFQPNARNMAVVVYHFTLSLGACAPYFTDFFVLEGNLATITTCPGTVQFEKN